MSFRANVDRSRIDRFLQELGRAFRHPARLYIVGGAVLVYEQLRVATLDINLSIEVDGAHHGDLMRQIARLKDQLSVNVEEASPADFIPIPLGWRERSPYAGRFGQIDVFYFDPVSTALSKLDRGHDDDFAAVRTVLAAGMITPVDLRSAWEEIAPRLPERGRSATQIAEFRENVTLILSEGG